MGLWWEALLGVGLAFGPQALGQQPAVDLSLTKGAFAVVTYKRGLAAAFAHNHLVVAPTLTAKIQLPGNGDLSQATFEATCSAKDLVVDDPNLQKSLLPQLQKAGLSVELSPLDQKDRATIYENMVAKDQLWAEKHTTIKAKLLDLKEKPKDQWSHEGALEMTIRGQTHTLRVPARVQWANNMLEVVAVVAKVPFSAFGITPYSAMLGAVGNQPDFSLYAQFTAKALGAQVPAP